MTAQRSIYPTFLLLTFCYPHRSFAITEWDFPADSKSQVCRILADNDVYGIGIRLGFYFQWFAALITTLSTVFSRNSADLHSIRVGYNIVSIAVLANSLRGSTDDGVDGGLLALELYIATAMTIGLGVLTAPPKKVEDSGEHCEEEGEEASLALVVTQLLFLTWCLLQPWIAFVLLGRRPTNSACEIKIVFFIYPIDIHTMAAKVLTKILAILFCAYGIYLLYPTWRNLNGIFRWLKLQYHDTEETAKEKGPGSHIHAPGTNKRRHALAPGLGPKALGMLIAQLLLGGMAITLNEVTIHKNNIVFDRAGISSSGQLIPLLVGIFSVLERIKAVAMIAFLSTTEIGRTFRRIASPASPKWRIVWPTLADSDPSSSTATNARIQDEEAGVMHGVELGGFRQHRNITFNCTEHRG